MPVRPPPRPATVRLALGVCALLLVAGGWMLMRESNRHPLRPRPSASPTAAPPPAPIPDPPHVAAATPEPPSPLADELNAPSGTIQRDLAILREVLLAWQTNFRTAGLPVGDNAEITAALTGQNPLRFQFIRRDHPAINARGELCDRWGTPWFFHALAADRMELRSAGPDRTLYSADDGVLTPERGEPSP